MTYTIYSYIQPNKTRKVGCTSNVEVRVEQQQTRNYEILDETDDKLEASHLEAYWKGKFQLPFDEYYVDSIANDKGFDNEPIDQEALIYISMTEGCEGNWFTCYDYSNKFEFRAVKADAVIFTDKAGRSYRVSKEVADNMVNTSRSKDNVYFSVLKVLEECEENAVEEIL